MYVRRPSRVPWGGGGGGGSFKVHEHVHVRETSRFCNECNSMKSKKVA